MKAADREVEVDNKAVLEAALLFCELKAMSTESDKAKVYESVITGESVAVNLYWKSDNEPGGFGVMRLIDKDHNIKTQVQSSALFFVVVNHAFR